MVSVLPFHERKQILKIIKVLFMLSVHEVWYRPIKCCLTTKWSIQWSCIIWNVKLLVNIAPNHIIFHSQAAFHRIDLTTLTWMTKTVMMWELSAKTSYLVAHVKPENARIMAPAFSRTARRWWKILQHPGKCVNALEFGLVLGARKKMTLYWVLLHVSIL